MTSTATVFTPAYAKINLTLAVLGRRDDGYHRLASVMQTISLHDTLRFTVGAGASAESHFTCDVAELATPDNLVARAAALLREETARPDLAVEIELHKEVPAQGGLGGAAWLGYPLSRVRGNHAHRGTRRDRRATARRRATLAGAGQASGQRFNGQRLSRADASGVWRRRRYGGHRRRDSRGAAAPIREADEHAGTQRTGGVSRCPAHKTAIARNGRATRSDEWKWAVIVCAVPLACACCGAIPASKREWIDYLALP